VSVARSFPRAAALAAVIAAVGSMACAVEPSATPNLGTAPAEQTSEPVCTTAGAAVAGPTDTHCAGKVQTITAAACTTNPDDARATGAVGSDPATADACAYGPTQANQESDDDECKYHIKWTTTPLCQGDVTMTVTITQIADGAPAAGIPSGLFVESFQPKSPTQACDVARSHPGQNAFLQEKAPGVYEGIVPFDAPGLWTLRFHIRDECDTLSPESPHGHVAYRVDVH
jgi:hypothetical protein